ncbi:LPS export ABC transporter periplasmic protein LptC [Oceanibaculum pacificum]|nr:LPS export ABC transporter periplasmic protein LptC [Oceanibaculum pacificum]
MSNSTNIMGDGAAVPSRRRSAARPIGYSRLVFLLKVLLPSVAVVLVGLVIVWPEFMSDDSRFRLGAVKVDVRDAETLNMVNPRFVGTDERNRPFIVTADSANQSRADSALVTLAAPKADMTMEDGTWVALTATNGLFDRNQQAVDLGGGVNVFHDSGYEFRSEKARIDMQTGEASGNQPVEGQGPLGQVEAQGFTILDKGARILFTGKAKMVTYPKEGDAKPAAGGAR